MYEGMVSIASNAESALAAGGAARRDGVGDKRGGPPLISSGVHRGEGKAARSFVDWNRANQTAVAAAEKDEIRFEAHAGDRLIAGGRSIGETAHLGADIGAANQQVMNHVGLVVVGGPIEHESSGAHRRDIRFRQYRKSPLNNRYHLVGDPAGCAGWVDVVLTCRSHRLAGGAIGHAEAGVIVTGKRRTGVPARPENHRLGGDAQSMVDDLARRGDGGSLGERADLER